MNNSHVRPWVATFLLAAAPAVLLGSEADRGQGNSNKAKNKDKQESSHSIPSTERIEVIPGVEVHLGEIRHRAESSHLTGVKPLPPGIRKNLARGKPMPPGIAKTRLPDSFLSGLPSREGYTWRAAGTDLVLVVDTDKVIAGILSDIFR